VKKADITGSWLNELEVKYVDSSVTECMWKEPPLVDNAYM